MQPHPSLGAIRPQVCIQIPPLLIIIAKTQSDIDHYEEKKKEEGSRKEEKEGITHSIQKDIRV